MQNSPVKRLHLVCHQNVGKQSYSLPYAWERAIDNWLTWLRLQGAKDTTLRVRRGQVRVIARRSGTRHPGDIDVAMLVNLMGRPGVSADHRHGQRAALVSFYNWCTDNDVVLSSPARLLPPVRASQPQPRPAPDDVWAQLIADASPREMIMAYLAGYAGLRRAEVAGLRCEHMVRDRDGWVLIVVGKGGKQRVVPITVSLCRIIQLYCRDGHCNGYLFPGNDHGHLAPDTVGRMISRLMPPGWSMHKLRHRFATRGYNGTHDLLAVQQALGHSSVATTQRYTAITLLDLRMVSEAAAVSEEPAGNFNMWTGHNV